MQTFKDKGISYCFMGGYAVALLGGERVTEVSRRSNIVSL